MEEKIQVPDACTNITEKGLFDSCLCESEHSDMKDVNVSDWVRRSVLFWNESDNSSHNGGSDDALFNILDQPDKQPDDRSDIRSDSPSDKQSDSASSEQENAFIANLSEIDKEFADSPPLKVLHDSQTEPTRISVSVDRVSTEDMKVDVENIQKLLIEPFIMEDDTDKNISCEPVDNDSTYYTLNFPKYSEHIYSPLYEEHVRLRTEKFNPALNTENDWNIAERLNRLSQTRGQLMSDNYNAGINVKETGELTNEHGEEMENANVDTDIFNAIKKVQDTLGEIADELETTRTRKASKDRDPKLILINLLSRIQPPVNRDSYSSSPIEEASQSCKELAELHSTSPTEEAGMLGPCQDVDATSTVTKGMFLFVSIFIAS